MSRVLFGSLTAWAGVVLSQALLAAEAGGPPRPGPEMMFKRLDANQDGRIVAEEIPPGAPERLKSALRRADTNGDEKVTAEEFVGALRRYPAGPPSTRSRRPGPPRSLAGGPPRGLAGKLPPHARLPRAGGPSPRLPDPKALFARWDRDRDGKLSLEEFAAGLRLLQRPVVPPRGGAGGLPIPGHRFGPPSPGAAGRFGVLAAEVFQRADANHDGKVTLDEVPSERRPQFRRLLERADKDGDQALSAEEARRAAAAVRMRVRTAMARRAAEARRAEFAKRALVAGKTAEAASVRAKRAAAARQPVDAGRKAQEARKAFARERAAIVKREAEARKEAARARKKLESWKQPAPRQSASRRQPAQARQPAESRRKPAARGSAGEK